jgi:hypothetical protein
MQAGDVRCRFNEQTFVQAMTDAGFEPKLAAGLLDMQKRNVIGADREQCKEQTMKDR